MVIFLLGTSHTVVTRWLPIEWIHRPCGSKLLGKKEFKGKAEATLAQHGQVKLGVEYERKFWRGKFSYKAHATR